MAISPDISWWENLSGNVGDIKNFKCDLPGEILINYIAKTHCSQLCKTTGSG